MHGIGFVSTVVHPQEAWASDCMKLATGIDAHTALWSAIQQRQIVPYRLSLSFCPQNEVHLLAPEELGHAAAYEAYRTWIHNSSMHEPLSGDIERQREALTGLAVAEGSYTLSICIEAELTYFRSGSPVNLLGAPN